MDYSKGLVISKQQGWDLNPSSQAPESKLLTTLSVLTFTFSAQDLKGKTPT